PCRFQSPLPLRSLHSFPTRRSSDLNQAWLFATMGALTFAVELGAPLALLNKRLGRTWAFMAFLMHWGIVFIMAIEFRYHLSGIPDRKSTRLNSSHRTISYAVFCLKK